MLAPWTPFARGRNQWSAEELLDPCPPWVLGCGVRLTLERWEHETVVDDHKRRMAQAGGAMKKRSQLVEHPFGTLKFRAGMHHFLMRGLEKCRGEFSLMVLCYNFTRVLNTLGLEAFRDYCAQRMGKTAEQPVYG